MIQLFSKEDFDKAKTKDLLTLQCEFCNNSFKTTKNTKFNRERLYIEMEYFG